MSPFPPTPLSPATQAAMAPASPEDETQLFEDKFGQMAHQVFSSQFPDLTNSVITFKILDSDIDKNSAVGSFIIEHQGQFLYVPVILSDNQLKPLDLVYVKDKDIFLPLTDEWITELSKGLMDTLGEGVKLPPTVATDVDIRNIVVPPTTGRYSYAHYVTPANRLAAAATEPLGRRLHKYASSVGESTDDAFNPEVWTTFNEQFQRVQGTTPGQAIDNNVMDVTTLAKMYKQHSKTWDLANQSAYAQGMDPAQMKEQQQQMGAAGQGMPGAQPQQMGGMPGAQPQQMSAPPAVPPQGMMRTASTASVAEDAISTARTHMPSAGGTLDNLLSVIRHGALGGAAIGGVRSGLDTDDLSEVPGGMIRGAVGGAVGAPIGRSLGGLAGHTVHSPGMMGMREARQLGAVIGGAGGGYLAAGARHTDYNRLGHPSQYLQSTGMGVDPYGQRYTTASDHSANIVSMLKHAQDRGHEHTLILPEFLKRASNNIKKGFAKVLADNPRLLKIAADIYGEDTLVETLTPTKLTKLAGMSQSGGALLIADKSTPPNDYFHSFGKAAPAAFNGVLLKGFYYKDSRPSLNLAVQTQEYHDFQDTRESGVYLVYPISKEPEAALVAIEPLDLLGTDRTTSPRDASTHVKKPMPEYVSAVDARATVRLFILGDGQYGITSHLIGEQIAEVALKGTKLFDALFTDETASPKAGKGVFIYKRGIHYFSTLPVELSAITTATGGVIKATAKSVSGWGREKTIVIDPRSPLGRISRPQDLDVVFVPARYKWLPLKSQLDERQFLSSGTDVTNILIQALGSMGVGEVVARRAGQSMYSIDGEKSTDKVAALRQLAEKHYIHATAAEAMLKIAEAKTVSRAYVVSPQQYYFLRNKIANQMPPAPPGMAMDPNAGMGQMGAPPAMGGAPMAAPPMDPNAGMAAPTDPNAGMEAPAPGNSIAQAFQETNDELQQQINQLQAQLDVLVTVQERANQIDTGAAGPTEQLPQDPALAQPPPQDMSGGAGGMPPAPPMDPSMGQPMDPSMGQQPADPSMAPYGAQGMDPTAGQPPPGPVMRTEEPSSNEIAAQVNPAFLEQAGQFQGMGAFDAGAVSSLSQNPSFKSISSQYAANLEDSVDDLGRTLLTLYMQEYELKEQLGEDAFVKLEDELRNTFKNLGELTLTMSHNTSQLNNRAPS